MTNLEAETAVAYAGDESPISQITLLTAKTVCYALAMSESQLYQMVNTGQFPPPLHIGRRHSRFVGTEVATFVNGLARGLSPEQRQELVQAIVAHRSEALKQEE